MRIRPYDHTDREAVAALWRSVFAYDTPHNEPGFVIDRKVEVNDGLFLVAEENGGAIVGTVMGGYDGHRGWIYSLAVAQNVRRRRLGSQLTQAVDPDSAIVAAPRSTSRFSPRMAT